MDLPLGAEPEAGPPRKPSRLYIFFAGVLLAAALAAILVPNFVRAGSRGSLTACKSNCKNIATALEMYASDNGGRYPVNLEKLTAPIHPGPYLKIIPTCPVSGRATYTGEYVMTASPDCFSFGCSGNNHGRSLARFYRDTTGYPKYHADAGLIEHP